MNVPCLEGPGSIDAEEYGQASLARMTQSTKRRIRQGTFAPTLPRKVEAGQAPPPEILGCCLPQWQAQPWEVAMTEEETTAASPMRWYATVQMGSRGVEDPNWTVCCAASEQVAEPSDLAQGLLERHADTTTLRYRVLVWANQERTGILWTYTRNSAHRFNPYTNETVDMDQLPFHELAEGDEPTENPILTPAVLAAQAAADDETAEGLALAAVEQPTPEPLGRNEYGGNVRIVSAEEELAAVQAMQDGMMRFGEPDKAVIRLALERQLTGAARSLENAIAAAQQFAADSGHDVPWHMHEAALTTVAIATAAYSSAFMYWKTYS